MPKVAQVVAGDPTPAISALLFAYIALALLVPPALGILTRANRSWGSRLLALLAMLLIETAVVYIMIANTNDSIATPWPWLAAVVPSYVLAWWFSNWEASDTPP